jgi:hypothetical protein
MFMFFRILVFFSLCFYCVDGFAQMLNLDAGASQRAFQRNEEFVSAEGVNAAQNIKSKEKQVETQGIALEDLMNEGLSKNKAQLKKSQKAVNARDDNDVFIPEGELYKLNTPTLDGSERSGQALVEVDEYGRMKKAENIFLFYDNFKITKYIKNSGSCDVRFNILSNLDRKISQIDLKLVWPGLTTTLSFANVAPNTQTYYNYSLIGDGCYRMDMAPNIIVNRCRVKGMTASECAGKIIWLSK